MEQVKKHFSKIHKDSFIIISINIFLISIIAILVIIVILILDWKIFDWGRDLRIEVARRFFISIGSILGIQFLICSLYGIFLIPIVTTFDYKNEKMEKSAYYIATIAFVIAFVFFIATPIFYMVWSNKMLNILDLLESKNIESKQIEKN